MTTTTATKWPEFGPVDQEGFRKIPFYIEGDEYLRVSANLERIQKYFTDTANDPEQYSSQERESLETAAAIVAAREDSPDHDPEVSLATIIQLAPDHTARYLEKWFPLFAKLALEAALNLCVKRSLDDIVRAMNVPGIYKEPDVERLLGDFNDAAKKFLKVETGRPRETQKHIEKGKKAFKLLRKNDPTFKNSHTLNQEQVAEVLNINDRTLRKWLDTDNLTLKEFLRLCDGDGKSGPELN